MEGISSFLPDFLRERAANDETTLIFLDELWPNIVGKDISMQCHPARLTQKKLVVTVYTEVWRDELAKMKQILIQAINQFWKVQLVEDLKFEVHLLEGDSASQ